MKGRAAMRKHDTDTDTDVIEEAYPAIEAAPVPVETVLLYDAPPLGYVPGTTYDPNMPPEEMTNEEWIQWAYDNKMPFWAIKKGVLQRTPPTISGIEPSTAAIGDSSFELKITGTNFHTESVIVFAGQSENTTLNEDGTLSTGVNMAYWHGADVLPVLVDNGTSKSEPVEFTFTAAAPEAEVVDDDEADEPAKKKSKRK
jgi:hypothetical protein